MRPLASGVIVASILAFCSIATTARVREGAITIDHYVRVKSIVPAIAGQFSQIYVRERVLAGSGLRGAARAKGVVLFVHGAGIRLGMNSACASLGRLQGSFIAAGRVERP